MLFRRELNLRNQITITTITNQIKETTNKYFGTLLLHLFLFIKNFIIPTVSL